MTTITKGDVLPPLTIRITRAQAVRYSGASTDFNPIHFSDRHARAVGLPGVVAHGMWTMGAALRVVTDWVQDPGRVASYFVRFVHPLVIPDDDQGALVEVRASVTAVDEERGLASVAIEATSGGQKLLGAARAEVRL